MHFTGFICEVEESVGGQVIMDVSSDCKGITNNKAKLFTVMKNPAIYVSDSAAISSSTGAQEMGGARSVVNAWEKEERFLIIYVCVYIYAVKLKAGPRFPLL